MFEKLIKALGPEGRLEEGGGELDRLRAVAAVGVVVASVFSAIAVLLGAVYDEHGSQDDTVYRQQLVTEQQHGHLREESVAADVALFGGYEQHVLRARDLQLEASMASSQTLANSLRAKAESRRAIATAMLARFHVLPWETTTESVLSYDPSAAYLVQGRSIGALAHALEPGEHRREARSAREHGVSMAWAAVLFLIALVFFTAAQVYARIKTPKKEKDKEKTGTPEAKDQKTKPNVPPSALRNACTAIGIGALFLLGGFVVGASAVL